ncbi:MAG: DMT family transporter [Acidimicrobiales bacterium]
MNALGATKRGGRLGGVAIAGLTALVSGVSVFVNSYGVRAGAAPDVYTTAKNLVAVSVLSLVAAAGWALRSRRVGSMAVNFVTPAPEADAVAPLRHWAQWMGLAYVGVIGGGLAFVLFFNGLAVSEPASAAFWRDTLVLWVAVLAVLFVRERVRWWNVTAILLLVTGEIVVSGGVGQLAANRGEVDVLASSVLWALEVVVARRLLRTRSPAALAVVRMGVGGVTLIGYLAASGSLGELGSLTLNQWRWAIWTGLLLGAYVATWMSALARARALDVTSVLAASALLTWLLQVIAGTSVANPAASGLLLVGAGAGLVLVAASRPSAWRRLRGRVT